MPVVQDLGSMIRNLVLPLTLDTRYYGTFLNPSEDSDGNLIDYLLSSNEFIEYNSKLENKLLGNEKIYRGKFVRRTIYIIVQPVSDTKFVKHIFTYRMLPITTITDTIINENTFIRQVGNNYTLVENDEIIKLRR